MMLVIEASIEGRTIFLFVDSKGAIFWESIELKGYNNREKVKILLPKIKTRFLKFCLIFLDPKHQCTDEFTPYLVGPKSYNISEAI